MRIAVGCYLVILLCRTVLFHEGKTYSIRDIEYLGTIHCPSCDFDWLFLIDVS